MKLEGKLKMNVSMKKTLKVTMKPTLETTSCGGLSACVFLPCQNL